MYVGEPLRKRLTFPRFKPWYCPIFCRHHKSNPDLDDDIQLNGSSSVFSDVIKLNCCSFVFPDDVKLKVFASSDDVKLNGYFILFCLF